MYYWFQSKLKNINCRSRILHKQNASYILSNFKQTVATTENAKSISSNLKEYLNDSKLIWKCFKHFNHAAFFYWNHTACATFSKYHSKFLSVLLKVLNRGISVLWEEMMEKRSLWKQDLSTKLSYNDFQTKL